MSATAAWSRGVAGADALRRGALRGLARTSAGRALMRDRARRLGALAILQVLAVTAVALAAPLWLLLLGPLLLGVPHVASDLRYFVVQPRTPWPPRALVAVGALLGLMTLQRVALAVGAPIPLPEGVSPLQSELGLGVSSVAAALWLGGWRRRRWPALLAVVIALAVAWRAPQAAFMAFGHGHNLVGPACALLLGWREAGRGRLADGALGGLSAHALVALAALTFVAAQGALLGGAFDGLLLGLGGLSAPATGLDLGDLEAQLAPGVGYPWSMRLTVSFAIAQAVHYAAWLRWLPQLWSPRRVPTPFAAALRRRRCGCDRSAAGRAGGLADAGPRRLPARRRLPWLARAGGARAARRRWRRPERARGQRQGPANRVAARLKERAERRSARRGTGC